MTSDHASRFWHRLPQAPLVHRADFLRTLCTDQRVAHIGFVDSECRDTFSERGEAWLHSELSASASSLVGLDIDAEGVTTARAAGYEAYAIDCCSVEAIDTLNIPAFDIVIAGEVIEHLSCPGDLLNAAKHLLQPNGSLVITTPNASRLANIVGALMGIEVSHPDHVVSFSYATLASLLARHGWGAKWHVYDAVRRPLPSERGLKNRIRHPKGTILRAVKHVQALAARTFAPFVADGFVVCCSVSVDD